MYSKNNKGPNTDPCGTPDLTHNQSENVPLTTTLCNQESKKSESIAEAYHQCPDIAV